MTEPRDENDRPEATTPEPETANTDDTAAIETPGPSGYGAPKPEPVAAMAASGGAARPTARGRVSKITGSRWLPPLATGLVGLMLGLMIGAVGMGLLAAVAFHHGPRAHHGPGDGRGHHWQDNRPPR